MAVIEDTAPETRRASAPPGPRRQAPLLVRILRDRTVLLFALPGMLVLIAFQYYPLLGNVIAFQDFQPYLGIDESLWSGFRNFSVLISNDPAFLNALRNTLILTLIQAVLVFPLPIVLALILNSLMSNRMRQIVQSILYLPHFLSWVIVVAVFQQMLGGSGLVNSFLRSHGMATLDIIGNADLFRALLTSQVIWKDTGWATILFLAVLAGIDKALYEAASVDGASRFRQMLHVTLPGMRPIIILLFILQLGSSLTVGFEQIILQQAAVGVDASEVLDTYVYNEGIAGGQWGTAAAVGLAKSVVGLILVLTANKIAHAFGEQGVYKA
ncbi:sugar ABC transporter ATPase [Brachybacterium phenoliresistens]|uniref:Sugar ABC transporter ATPase n=1 Tax=Brachybacterium phenoliresistens TaxID=396014 RepID=Z9JVI7_9MICO|nr:ABC transporter permease subunit [Brachybacterium phenoliresistens]EWS81816.1 sugar ABC transporter ATPase [Brachybacterium phenoliresistens]